MIDQRAAAAVEATYEAVAADLEKALNMSGDVLNLKKAAYYTTDLYRLRMFGGDDEAVDWLETFDTENRMIFGATALVEHFY